MRVGYASYNTRLFVEELGQSSVTSKLILNMWCAHNLTFHYHTSANYEYATANWECSRGCARSASQLEDMLVPEICLPTGWRSMSDYDSILLGS